MVDLPRVNASKTVNKTKREEETKRWQKMQKAAEQKRFEEKMFANKQTKESLIKTQKHVATRDADIYRFAQNKEYNKFKQLLKDNNSKNKNQQFTTQNNKQKILRTFEETKHKTQQDSRQQAYNNKKLTKQNETSKNTQQQRLETNQESTRTNRDNILERNKQQFQQDNHNNMAERNITANKQTTGLQYKENKLLQQQTNKQNKYNLDDKLNKQTQQKSNASISKSQTVIKEKSNTEKQLTANTNKTQQEKQQVTNSLQNSIQNTKKRQLDTTRDTHNQDNSSLRLREKAINDTSKQSKSRTLDISQNKYSAEINKHQLDSNNIRKNKTTLDFVAKRQLQDDISNKQSTDKISKNYLSQHQSKAEQIAKQETSYKQYSKQDKQEKDEQISVEKLYQENKVLPLPKNIDPSTTISQALQNPAQRVEVINHIVELIKTYRPFILKEGAFNIIMPGAFWEGTKIIVDIYKKDLEVKISASNKVVSTLEQNKSPLVEALKMADPNLNIKVDIQLAT